MTPVWEQPLWNELDTVGDDLLEEAGDYGYGGEWLTRTRLDVSAAMEFIEARERRLLGGKTLAEYAAELL